MASREQLTAWLEAARADTPLTRTRVVRPSPTRPWVASRNVVVCLEGDTCVAGRPVTLRVGLTRDFPDVLPYVQLVAAEDEVTERFLGHIEWDQNICFTATREVALDPQRPVELILRSLEAATTTLQSSLLAVNNDEVLREFASYWAQALPPQNALPILFAHFTPDNRLRTVLAWQSEDYRLVDAQGKVMPNNTKQPTEALTVIAVAEDPEAPQAYRQGGSHRFLKPSRNALYLPLQPGDDLVPPRPDRLWSAGDLRRIVRANLAAPDLELLEQLLAGRNPRRDLIILGVPRPGHPGVGRYALVAVIISRMKGGAKQPHLLTEQGITDGVRVDMQMVRRADRAFVMRRGGSDDTLSSKKVLLLGVGSLGGHAATMLASAGVGHLTLIDDDVLSLDNAFRHVLGRLFVGKNKVDGMAVLLRERFPYLRVEPISGRANLVLKQRRVRLEDFDLIFDATASTTNHLTLADLLSGQRIHPPLLLSWLEPLGLGGHVVTSFASQPGCPRCLYSDPDIPLTNAASFAAASQEFGQDAIGCGSYYTSFSDLDAIRTAELAARTAIDVLKGKTQESLVFSWRGDPAAFLEAGHRLSPRFTKISDGLLSRGLPYSRHDCPNCRRDA